MSLESISAIAASMSPLSLTPSPLTAAQAPGQTQSFQQLLMQGLREVESRVASADSIVQKFALDDNVPVHQVTIALEEAQLSVELAMQVRTRLLESFRDLMNMQI
jgi:flagellar hook-basal body complex protein FliE